MYYLTNYSILVLSFSKYPELNTCTCTLKKYLGTSNLNQIILSVKKIMIIINGDFPQNTFSQSVVLICASA